MSLALLQNNTAMAPNGLTTPFQGSGGTAPYTYSVLAGGPGGSISSSGIYTSPNTTGVDTVEVTDSLSATATAQILIGNPLELFCDIISNQMGLSQGQAYLWDQKILIPTDSRLYVAVGVISCKPFANSNTIDPTTGNSLQSVNMQAFLSVDRLSRGPDARDRKEQVILALESQYARSQQELNSFYVGKISSGFVNLSTIDGAAIPYRFNISVQIQYFVSSASAQQYFNTFSNASIYTNS